MNKQAKGAVAAGAAAILLLGGAGTFALWSDTEILDGGTIASGELFLTPDGAGAWADVSDITPGPIPDIDDFLVVPGDVLTYTAGFTVEATGDNLKARLTANESTITGDADLLARMEISVAATLNGTPVVLDDDIVEITSSAVGQDLDVVVTFTFDVDTPDLVAQNEAIDLSDFALTLQQHREP